jgi:Glycosyltransferase family 87
MGLSASTQVTVKRAAEQRIRRIAVALAIATWGVLAVNLASPGVVALNGHLKGEDYSHFYVLGRLVLEGRSDLLYDTVEQSAYLKTAIPGAPTMYFVPVYGPHVALAFAPLAFVSYLPSLAIWSVLTALVYFACCAAIVRRCPQLAMHRRNVAILVAASPGLWQLIVHGQNSALALLSLTGGWLLLQRGRTLAAGLTFGLVFYKPQLGLAIGFACLLTRHWRVLVGTGISVIAQIAGAWLVFGTTVMRDYLDMLERLPQIATLLEPKPYLLHSFRGFFAMIVPGNAALILSMGCSIAILALVTRLWRSGRDSEVTFAALMIAALLISPHTSVYDLALLTPALLILADRTLAAEARSGEVDTLGWVLIASAFLVPLLPMISQYLHVQPSVVCLSWLLVRASVGSSQSPVPSGQFPVVSNQAVAR